MKRSDPFRSREPSSPEPAAPAAKFSAVPGPGQSKSCEPLILEWESFNPGLINRLGGFFHRFSPVGHH